MDRIRGDKKGALGNKMSHALRCASGARRGARRRGRRPHPRYGVPPISRAGACQHERGRDRGHARAGKPTIYARFPSKEALFTAVMMRTVAANIARFEIHAPKGATTEERLESMGAAILHWVLVSDSIELMRLAIAEGRRFPELASRVHRMARERGSEAVARILGEMAQSDELGKLPAFAPERLSTTTRFFFDLVLFPLLMRALTGEKLKQLCAEIEPHVARSVAFFIAACRHGGVTFKNLMRTILNANSARGIAAQRSLSKKR